MKTEKKPDTIDDGGPAFPQYLPKEQSRASSQGVTVRDYFAAKAMQAIYAGSGATQVANRDLRYDETNWSDVVAANAYEMADAMLDRRKKGRR